LDPVHPVAMSNFEENVEELELEFEEGKKL
jgi:hypothetical protein